MLAATYRPFPTYPVIHPNASIEDVGWAVLRYVIAEDGTSVLSLEELEQADRVGAIAVAGYGKDGTPALEGIQKARTLIAAGIRYRKAENLRRAAADVVAEPEVPTAPDALDAPTLTDEQLIAAMFKEMMRLSRNLGKDKDNPDGGKKVRLQKPRPTLPSGGVALATRPS